MKAPSPREEKGRENRGALVAAASGDLKTENGGNGLEAGRDEDSTEIGWRESLSGGEDDCESRGDEEGETSAEGISSVVAVWRVSVLVMFEHDPKRLGRQL